jgi:hypothetical protein
MDKLISTTVLLALVTAREAHAQCKPPLNSNEAKLLAFYEAPVVFAPASAPLALGPGQLGIVGELETVPSAPSALDQTHDCYIQSTESAHLSPLLPRVRLSVGLPLGFAVEGSYEPRITVAGATPSFGSLAVSYTHALTPFVTIQARAHGTTGTVDGPITCPRSALQQSNPAGPCWGTQVSDDQFSPNSVGTDVTGAVTPGGGRLTAYGGAGYVYMPAQFRVGFTNLSGLTDHTVVQVGLSRETLFGGVSVRLISSLSAGAQVYAVPADVTTVRASLSYRL